MRGRRPARLRGFSYRGHYRYFTTCCVESRRAVFTTDRVVLPLMEQVLRTWSARGFAILAYVVMPDHLHLLVEGREDEADFRGAMMVFRQRTALTFRRETGTTLWQDGYYERVLRRDEALLSTAAYIIQNPVRARLVQSFDEYPYLWADPILELTRR